MFRRLLIAFLSAACACSYAQVSIDYTAADQGIRRYLEEVDYSGDADYTVSYVKDYKDKGAVSRAGLFQSCVLYEMVSYLRSYGYPQVQSINQLVWNRATARHSGRVDPLTPEEIALLRDYLIVK